MIKGGGVKSEPGVRIIPQHPNLDPDEVIVISSDEEDLVDVDVVVPIDQEPNFKQEVLEMDEVQVAVKIEAVEEEPAAKLPRNQHLITKYFGKRKPEDDGSQVKKLGKRELPVEEPATSKPGKNRTKNGKET